MPVDERLRQTLEYATAALRSQLEHDLTVLAEELRRGAAEESERASRAAAELEALKQALDQERERAAQQAAEAAAADMRRQAEMQAQAAELEERARRQIEEMRRAAADERERAVHEARDAAAEETRRQAERQIAELRINLQGQLDEVRRAAQAQAEAAARTARAEAEEVVIAQLAVAHAEADRKVEGAVERARIDAHQAEMAQTARLVDAIRRLDDARTLAETLDSLADCAARQVERAAVLVVKGDKLRVHRLAGFAGAPSNGDLDLEAAGVAGAVVASGVTVSRPAVAPGDERGSRQPALPPFAHDAGARHAVAFPVTVGGRVVAVLYADAPRVDAPSAAGRWPAVLEILARHASRALEALTVQQAAGLSLPRRAARSPLSAVPGPVEHVAGNEEEAARRYARLLLSEIRMYHEPTVEAGRRSRDLRARLSGEIDRARRLYEDRIPPAVRDRSEYFEQELVRTLADGDRSLLG